MTGLLPLLKAALRRDRWSLLWWTLGLVALFYATAASLPITYTSQDALDRAAASLDGNAAYVALSGPTRALDTIGGQVAWQAQVFGAVMIALMAMFLVVRHTRQEEENGRDEVLRSTPVGRLAPALAGVVTSLGISLMIGVLAGLSLIATGLGATDSMAMGIGLTGVGWVYTGTAWIAAQIGSTSRSAYALAGSFIGLTYGLRAVGDVAQSSGRGTALEFLRWLSPIGWYSQLQAFSGLRWWPLLLSLAGAAGALALAARLVHRRDYGAGLRADRPGPATGSIRGGLGLAYRLHRGPIIGWSLGMLLGGVAYGSIGDGAGDLIGDSEAVTDVFVQGAQSIVDGFFGMALVMLAIIASAYAVMSASRPRSEEEGHRVELLLSGPLGRRRWLLGHVLATVIGTTIVLACAGIGLGLGYAVATGDTGYGGRLAVGMMQYLPSVLVLSGVARLLHGVLPQRMMLAWVPVIFTFVVLFFGELFRFPGWLRGLSPFHHPALIPAEPFRLLPVLVVALVALALSVVGHVAFGRRDVG